MINAIHDLLVQLNIRPVLLDIGAAGDPPQIWDALAPRSVYVGFDPDLREMREASDGRFHKSIIANEAVVAAAADEVSFYLTQSPQCSSTLPPDSASLANYLFSDLFAVESQAKVRATTLNALMDRLNLPSVDWFKTDSQGTDLRLFTSLKAELRDRVLAVDLEPGLIDAYIGEDLFVAAHEHLTRNGFWLSHLQVLGEVRMRRATLDKLRETCKDLNEKRIRRTVRPSPGWCEARYLRTLGWLAEKRFGRREYVLLWAFALLDGQLGFALDLAMEYERAFGKSSISEALERDPIQRLRAANQPLRRALAKIVPRRFQRRLSKLLHAGS
jgi:hypothetical protein